MAERSTTRNTDRWQRMWSLFHEALPRTAGERDELLANRCGDDAELRNEVEELLSAHGRETELPCLPAAGADPDSLVGSRVGPYSILGVIGEGGMGVVYLAEQAEPLRRRVALKLIRLGMNSREIVARFEAERQALALMSHPHIARVLDAGATEDGRPYFVMEHVAGVPITEYCDRHRLTIRQRLRLFASVCEAVQHAHQKGIIHRDLKPSNVLVTRDGDRPVPKVIDFGIAKALSGRLTEKTLFTGLGRLIGTPELMSPEQADLGELDLDTRVDVYALGALLYALLVGRLPFDSERLRRANLSEIQRILREEEPPAPSQRWRSTSPSEQADAASLRQARASAVAHELSGELDWITRRAMEKDRARRYATASELAADIERFLTDQPILAGPPGLGYRLRKLVARHRAAFATAAAICVLAVGFGVSTAAQSVRLSRALANQEVERLKAEQVNIFLGQMLAGASPYVAQGRDTTLLLEILADADRRIATELGDQPRVAATLHDTLSDVYAELGHLDKARGHGRSAVELLERELGRDHPETLEATGDLALVLWQLDSLDESERITRETLARKRRILGPEHPNTLTTMNNLALVLRALERLDEAGELYEEVLEARRRTLGAEDPNTLISMSNLAVFLRRRGQLDRSLKLQREATEIQRRTLGENHPDTLISLDILGSILSEQGELEEAERISRQALEGLREVMGDGHPETLIATGYLTEILLRRGEMAEAERLLRPSLAAMRTTFGEEHRIVVANLHRFGRCLTAQGKLGEAEDTFVEARHLARAALPPDHDLHPLMASAHGEVLLARGAFAEAEELLEPSFAALRDALGAADPATHTALQRLIRLYERWDRPAKVDEYRALLES